MRRKTSRRKAPRKLLITAVTTALVILIIVVTGVLLVTQRPVRPPERPKDSGNTTITRPVIIGEEYLIKGCLYELGIPRDRVSVKGRTVHVSVSKIPPAERIRRVFDGLEKGDGVKVRMDEPSRVTVTMNGNTWDVIFSAVRTHPATRARVAIIVDDMGQDMAMARRFAAIDADLTFAVLPRERYTSDVAHLFHKHGRQVLLHLPMEGNGKNPGDGAIYGDTDPEQAAQILRESLGLVPYAQGVNNHMGSVVTRNRDIMDRLFSVLKEKDLFFVDSLTTGASVCRAAAEDASLPFEARDVFLDNEQSDAYIAGQVQNLVEAALRHGEAIGICHPHEATYRTLAREVPRLADTGIEVVRVSELVDGTYR